jgi:hypothetical protein
MREHLVRVPVESSTLERMAATLVINVTTLLRKRRVLRHQLNGASRAEQ